MAATHDRTLARGASRRPTALEWLAAITVVLVIVFQLVIKPLAQTAVRAAGSVVEGLAEGIGAIVKDAYVDARASIEHDPLVIVMLGQPVLCQPIEQATFLAGPAADEFEFTFDVVGPRGTATARVVVAVTDNGSNLKSLVVTDPNRSVHVPTAP